MPETVDLGWHIISGEDLLELLRRAHAGEDPDFLYMTEYVNAERDGEDEAEAGL